MTAQAMTPQTPSERWFGSAFDQLYPRLQELHRHGGTLIGSVDYELAGTGVAGWLARRIARGMHLPEAAGRYPFRVHITHEADALIWSREFAGAPAVSRFVPTGHFPQGYWRERFGALDARLGVAIDAGGWRWLMRSMRWRGVPVPLWCLLQSQAAKRITPAGYEFEVEVELVLSGWGRRLRYHGVLHG